MSEYTLPVRIVRRANMVLKDVQIVSSEDRAASVASSVLVEVGAAFDGKFDVYGSYNQTTTGLVADVARSILSPASVNRRLRDRQNLQIRVTTSGSPATLVGTAVEFVFMLVGGAGGPLRPLVTSREQGLDDLATQINSTGVNETTATVYLVDPPDSGASFQAEDDHGTTKAISSTTYVASDVAVTATLPAGASIGYVKVDAVVSFVSNSAIAGSLLYGAIGDGTTNHGEQKQTTGVLAALLFDNMKVTFAGEITATTTFTLMVKVDAGGAAADLALQSLSLFASYA